jgi:pyruvate dehydrogenase E2 component (dihydrolipoamide acetyltransferase)
MSAEIVMPRLSDTMEEGTILRWLKRSGEPVARGEEIVEIETDKASMPYAADREGTLEIIAQEGQTLPVGAPIARVSSDREQAAPDSRAAEQSEGDSAAQPGAGASEQPAPPDLRAPERRPAGNAPARAEDRAGRIKASPLARRLAAERGLELGSVAGSGPGGRIVKADIEGARSVGGASAQGSAQGAQRSEQPARGTGASAPGAEQITTAKGGTSVHALTRTQQLIARRMAESRATIPAFSLQAQIDMEACVALRAQIKEHARGEVVPTYNDMLVKATAIALREHSHLNATYRDGALEIHERVNIGIAVATGSQEEHSSSLIVPTIFDADRLSLGEIARSARAAAARVRAGTITPPELSGATFTISNLGMFGVSAFEAIINPPQVAILAAGSVERRAVVRGEEIRPRATLIATLACDHRALYGADAAIFLARVRELLEAPDALAL